jgi:hypothetical protein
MTATTRKNNGLGMTEPPALKWDDINQESQPNPNAKPAYHANPDYLRNLPDDLTERDQWVLWRFVFSKGRWTKVPFQINGEYASTSSDPDADYGGPLSWNTYEAVLHTYLENPGEYAGIGFVFSSNDPLCGIDFDGSLDASHHLTTSAVAAIVEQLHDCYMEISPSGTGLKIWIKAKLPGTGLPKNADAPYPIEIYDQGRFFTVTGSVFNDAPRAIEEHQHFIENLYRRHKKTAEDRPKDGAASSDTSAKIGEGKRHNTLVSLAGTMRRRGFSGNAINAALQVFNTERCSPPKDKADVRKIAESAENSWKPDAEPEPVSATGQASAAGWDLLPLQHLPVERFPAGLLPDEVFGPMVEAVVAATETPRELAVMLGLGVVALSIAGKVEVQPSDNADYTETTNLYTCAAMESGNRKTAVLNFMKEPVVEWEIREAANFPYRENLKSERKTIEAQIELIRKRKRVRDKDGTYEPIEALQSEIADLERKLPVVPVIPQLWSQDITPEHLGTVMVEQKERLALLSAEGGLFETFAGRYSKTSVPNLDLLLQAYDGSPAKVDRAGRVAHLQRPVLTVAIAPQPDVLTKFAAHPEFRNRGLVGRFLYAMPPSPLGYRDNKTMAIPSAVRMPYGERITRLINIPTERDALGRVVPEILGFTKQGRDIWKDFEATNERRMRDDGIFSESRDWASKFPGKVARLAVHLYAMTYEWNKRPSQIQLVQVETAAKIAEILTSHALAALRQMQVDETVNDALTFAEWLKKEHKDLFSFREAFSRFQRKFKRADAMRPCLNLLIEHGYVLSLGKETGKKTEMYRTNPQVLSL